MANTTCETSESLERLVNTDVHLIIRRKNMTLFLDMLESTSVFKLKKMIEAILKVQPVDQQLFVMFANNCQLDKYIELSHSPAYLYEYELTSSTAKVTHPAIVGLALRQEDGSFESLEVTPYSDLQWPELVSDFPNDNDLEKRAAFNEKYEKMLQELNMTKPGPSKRATRK